MLVLMIYKKYQMSIVEILLYYIILNQKKFDSPCFINYYIDLVWKKMRFFSGIL